MVDDSAYIRLVLRRALDQRPDFQVVGEARDGFEALEVVPRTNPDVITLDVEMPRLNGLATLKRLMATHPWPVIMVSSLATDGAVVTLRALELGAVDFVTKPDVHGRVELGEMIETLIAKIRVAVTARISRQSPSLPQLSAPRTRSGSVPRNGVAHSLVVIGCSTGGPRALTEVVPRLNPALPAAYVIVQHMPSGFTHSLAERLDQLGTIWVREAAHEDRLVPGQALVAPGNWHLLVGPHGRVALSQAPRLHGVRPAVDVTLQAAASVYGNRTVAVVLTGMGSDGTEGCSAVRAAGGRVIAEAPSTCVVDGMPRSVREHGLADAVLPIDQIAEGIQHFVKGM